MEMSSSAAQVAFAFGITLLAGLATGIGSAIAYFARRTDVRFLAVALGFSGGVMLYISFTEILSQANATLTGMYGRSGPWIATVAFFAGMIVMGIIDRLVPSVENPHEAPTREALASLREAAPGAELSPRLLRMGLFSAIAISVHNFPEGIATFLSAIHDPQIGVAIGIAVALHNIPEGVAVSIPVYYATGSRRKAFLYSFLSGISEPIGALLGYLLLASFASAPVLGISFAAVAGVMVYISLDELLPTAREYGSGHQVLYGLLSGMAVIALSLLMLA
jgi:zinc transporter, ZIP family